MDAAIEPSKQQESPSVTPAQQAELNRLKANLLSTMSHEMRTPLATIKGYSTMLLDYDSRLKRAEKREFLQAIDKATDRLDQMMASFLDNARLEAGTLRLNISVHQVSDLMDKSLAAYDRQQLPGNRSLSLEVAANLPRVPADSKRMTQVIGHIVDNAVKYSTPGTEISVRAGIDGRNILISVANKGSSISPEDKDAIFQPLYRLEERNASASGSGLRLSLALCKAIVQLHGGRIWAESREGQDTVLCISLPSADTTEGDDLGGTG